MKPKLFETSLYEPVKSFFTEKGYDVYGEVKGCDLTAVKGDELIIVELKLSFNLKLLYQALDRKKLTEHVYVAIPRPRSVRSKHYLNCIQVLKALGIGLLVVSLDSSFTRAEVVHEPEHLQKRQSKRRKSSVLKEISGRSIDANKGGRSKGAINTAFRERSIKIACTLEKVGECSPKNLIKQFDCPKDTGSIVSSNFYGWFVRVKTGVYALSEKGRAELLREQFLPVVNFYRDELARNELERKDLERKDLERKDIDIINIL